MQICERIAKSEIESNESIENRITAIRYEISGGKSGERRSKRIQMPDRSSILSTTCRNHARVLLSLIVKEPRTANMWLKFAKPRRSKLLRKRPRRASVKEKPSTENSKRKPVDRSVARCVTKNTLERVRAKDPREGGRERAKKRWNN